LQALWWRGECSGSERFPRWFIRGHEAPQLSISTSSVGSSPPLGAEWDAMQLARGRQQSVEQDVYMHPCCLPVLGTRYTIHLLQHNNAE
jgi:hypothetical protein